MRLAVVGSREWANPDAVAEWIDGYLDDFHGTVITGGAPGVDTWAEETCARRGIPVEVVRPVWRRPDGTYNKGAAFMRNGEIVKRADEVVVIWNGISGGSRNVIDHALEYRKKLLVHFPEP